MSGTAALAAARKRRANPQPNGNGNYTPQPTSSSMAPIKEEEVPKATNPAMLLMQHNMLIQKLQKEVAELKAQSQSQSKSLKDLNPKVDTDYKSEYLGLLEEMKEMKKVLLKVQSFSMETNLDVMKLKRTVEQNQLEHVQISQNRMNQSYSQSQSQSIITITDDIDSIAESSLNELTSINQLNDTGL
jgi:hypothetical protein